MRKSRPSLKGLAEFVEAAIGGSGPIFGVNLDGSVRNATRNRKEQKMLKSKKGLKTRGKLHQYSERRVRQLNSEVIARSRLCERCGGTPIQQSRMVKVAGNHLIELNTIICLGGNCEICGQPAGNENMSPHEYKVSQGQGGKVSMGNSVMCHCHCHDKRHITPRSELKPIIPPKKA